MTDLQKPFTDEQLKAWASLLHFSWPKGNDVMSAGPALAARVIELEADNKRLREAILDIKQNWDWWDEDRYDRCSSVVGDAIADALKGGEI